MKSSSSAAVGIPVAHRAGIDLGQGFRRPWKRILRSPFYTIGVFAVAAVMVLVPIIYFTMIAAVGVGAYLFVIHNWHRVTAVPGRSMLLTGALFLLVPLAALILIAIMLRMLLARPRVQHEGFSVSALEEPSLHAFVEVVCRTIGAPPPKRIDVNATVNASASFRTGLWSVFRRGDVVLTIGMPLVSGLRLNEFAGILAHEFGHFSQGFGMRAGYVSAILRTWLHLITQYRDEMEWRLQQTAADPGSSGYFKILWILIGSGSWLARTVLKALLFVANIVSSYMARQMEYDADRHEVRFVGTKTFESTSRRMIELEHAFGLAMNDVQDYWRRGTLPDDLSSLVATRAARVTPEVRAATDRAMTESSAGLFSTHPSTAARVRHARALDEQGVFDLDLPAAVLFRDFNSASKKASYAFYKELLGEGIFSARLVPVGGLIAEAAREVDRAGGAASYLGLEPPAWRPMFLPMAAIEASLDPKKTAERLKSAKAEVKSRAAASARAVADFVRCDPIVTKCDAARMFRELGFGRIPKDFGIDAESPDAAERLRAADSNTLIAAASIIDETMEHGVARLSAALRLLHTKGLESKVPEHAALRARSVELVAALAALKSVFADVRDLRVECAKAGVVSGCLARKPAMRDRVKEILRPLSDTVRDRLDRVRRELGGVNYPFEHPEGQINFGSRLIGASPAWRDFDAIFAAAETLLDRYPEDVRRVGAELVEIGAKVEAYLKSASAPPPAKSDVPRAAG